MIAPRKIYRRPDGRPLPDARTQKVRAEVIAKSKGICAVCEMDVGEIIAALRTLRKAAERVGAPNAPCIYARELRRQGYDVTRPLFEVDHIVPLSEGGADSADNMQVICQACGRDKTKEDAQRRARKRPRKTHKQKQGLCDGSGRRPGVVARTEEGRVLGCKMCGATPGIWHGMVARHASEKNLARALDSDEAQAQRKRRKA